MPDSTTPVADQPSAARTRARERQDDMLGAIEVGLWYCDLPFDVLQWDRKVKEHFWLPPDATVTIDTFYERMHPDDRERTRAAIARSIDEHAPYDIEYRTIPPADHPQAGAVRWVRAIGYTGYGEGGRPIRFDGVTVDVTPQKRAEEALAASERRTMEAARRTAQLQELTAALASATSEAEVAALVMHHAVFPTGAYAGAIVERTADGTGVEIRASIGYPEAACMGPGRHWPLDATIPVVECVRTGAPVTVASPDEWLARWPGGYAPPPASASRAWAAFPIGTADGPPAAMLWTFAEARAFSDDDHAFMAAAAQQGAQALERARLRERERRARREAEVANRAKSEFLARMSHDLRTPLNAIGGYAQLIEMGVHGPVTGAQQEALARVSRAQQHLLTLINDILSFARLEAGQVPVVVAPTLLAPVLEELGGLALPDATARGLVLECAPCAPDVHVHADRERLLQVLLNLAGNAIKFTDAGDVRVWAEADEREVRVHVRDTGIGIAPDRIATIFQPFVQAHGTVAERREGVGLGLAISHELTRIMGGTLGVESAPGAGSTFTLALPRA